MTPQITEKNPLKLLSQTFIPACFENLNFLRSTEEIFSAFASYAKWRLNDYTYQVQEGNLIDSIETYLSCLYAIGLSGGSLVKRYQDPNMDKSHQRTAGDLDLKFSLCSKKTWDNIKSFLAHYKKFDGNIYLRYLEANPTEYLDDHIFNMSTMSFKDTLLIQAFHALLMEDYSLNICYDIYDHNRETKKSIFNRGVVVLERDGLNHEFVFFSENIIKHLEGADISATAGISSPFINNGNIYFPFPQSKKDFTEKKLNLLFPGHAFDLLDEDLSRLPRFINFLSSTPDYTLSEELKWIISEYIKHHKDNVFSSLKPGKLYRQLELLFFTGHAVKNLKLLQELNLFEELFGYVRTLLAKDKELTLYLVQRVCEESDQDASLWPSLLFYAIHWNSMKKRTVPYDLERISRISRPTIQFYHFDKEMQAIRVNQDKNGRDVLNESIHQSILAFLVECEEAYKNRLINQDAMTLLEEIFPGAATLERSESELYLDKSNASSEDNITTSESDLSGEFEFPALRSDKEATDEVLNHFVSEEVAGIFSQILDGQLQEESDIATENRLKQLTNEILNKILNEVTAEKPFEMVSEVLNELIQEELETAAEYWFLRGKSLAQQNTHQDPAQKAAQEILTLASYEKALSIESHHILAHQACIDIYSKTKTALLPNLSSKKLKKETQKKIKNINEKILQHCNALIDIPKETYTLLCAADTGLPEYSDFIYSVTCQRAEIYFALGKNNNAMNDWLQAREHNITKGNYAEALVCYKKILAINPHHLPILKEYITISMELDDEIQREALNYCTTLIEHEILEKAHDSLRYWAYCQQGKIFTTLGEYKKARASFKSAAALNAKLPEAYYKIADLIKRNAASESNQKKQNELYIQATNSYNEALKYDPECSVAHWGLGEIAEAQGDLDKAEECYQKSLGIKSEKSIEAVAQRKIVQQKKAALAIKTDENSRAITPQIVEISDSGEKTDKQVFADVIQLTAMEAEAIAKTEADSEHWFQLARENHRHCQYEQAKASYKKTLEINSQHILARRYLVDLYILLNRPTEALTEANFLIEINQSKSDQFDYYHALYQRGRVHLMTNQVDRAKQDLDRVIAQLTQKKSKKSSKTLKNSPQELKWSNLLAHVYFSMGEWVEVQLRTEREKFKAPEMLEIEYIGTEKDGYQAYQKPKVSADRTHENETITQTILELENQAKTFYEKSLDYLPLAQVYAALGNLEKARALTCFVYVNIYKTKTEHLKNQGLLRKDDKKAASELKAAQAKQAKGTKHLKIAKEHFEAALKINPQSPEAYAGLGDLAGLYPQIDRENIKKNYLHALKYYPRFYDIYLKLAKIEKDIQNTDMAISYYRQYLEGNTLVLSPEEMYLHFYELAESINDEKIASFVAEKLNADNAHPFIISEYDRHLMILSRDVYSRAIQYSTKTTPAHFKLAAIAFFLENHDETIERTLPLIEENFGTAYCSKKELYYILGECYKHKKDYLKAKKYFNKVLEPTEGPYDHSPVFNLDKWRPKAQGQIDFITSDLEPKIQQPDLLAISIPHETETWIEKCEKLEKADPYDDDHKCKNFDVIILWATECLKKMSREIITQDVARARAAEVEKGKVDILAIESSHSDEFQIAMHESTKQEIAIREIAKLETAGASLIVLKASTESETPVCALIEEAEAIYGLAKVAESHLSEASSQHRLALIEKEQAIANNKQAKARESDAKAQEYLALARENLSTNADTNTFEFCYKIFYDLAQSIIKSEKIEPTNIALDYMKRSSNLMPALDESDCIVWDLAYTFYQESTQYSQSPLDDAYFKLFCIAIILTKYDEAIERIQKILAEFVILINEERPLPKTIYSQRDLFYFCARLYDLEGNNSQAESYYCKSINAGNPENHYADDGSVEAWIDEIKKLALNACLGMKRKASASADAVSASIIGTSNVFSKSVCLPLKSLKDKAQTKKMPTKISHHEEEKLAKTVLS